MLGDHLGYGRLKTLQRRGWDFGARLANGSCRVLTCASKKSLLRLLHDLGKRKAEWECEIEAPAVGK
jgi:hypothetical protein